jgi:CheY-like chemotaxis protein
MTHAIIAIDDEPNNLALIENYLEGTDYHITCFAGGAEALAHLRQGAAADAILLDRMMPGMDGIAFMKEFSSLGDRRSVPVIMQTAAVGAVETAEGIAAGAYYYLTKPYSGDVLKAIVARALADRDFHLGMEKTVAQMHVALGHLETIRLSFRNLDDVRAISYFLASLTPDPTSMLLGITDLMLNAVEHGNLGISYATKSALLREGRWLSEVERRLNLPENRDKRAHIEFKRDPKGLFVTIEDQGQGFDWTEYDTADSARAHDSHGRGIAMALMVSFDEIIYVAPGNKVVCRKQV